MIQGRSNRRSIIATQDDLTGAAFHFKDVFTVFGGNGFNNKMGSVFGNNALNKRFGGLGRFIIPNWLRRQGITNFTSGQNARLNITKPVS
jgi:hypothetical protein